MDSGGHEDSTTHAEAISSRPWYFSNQAMGTKKLKASADLSALSFSFERFAGAFSKKVSGQISIAEAVDEVFST